MSVLVRRAVCADGDHLLRLARAFHAEDSHPLSEIGAAALLAMLEPEFGDGLVSLLVVEGAHCGYGSLTFGYSVEPGLQRTEPPWFQAGTLLLSPRFNVIAIQVEAVSNRSIRTTVFRPNKPPQTRPQKIKLFPQLASLFLMKP